MEDNKIDIALLRISKKEGNEKTQLPILVKHYKLKNYLVFKDKMSGYNVEIQEKREGLNKVRELIKLGKVKGVYVYSLERIYRNIELLLEFYFFCRVNDVEIYSYLQPEINSFNGDSPINIFLKYNSVLVNGFMGQNESYLISQRTKKSFHINKEGERVSYKGNRSGKKLEIGVEEANYIISFSKGMTYRQLKEAVKYNFNKNVSTSTISKIIKGELKF